LGFGGAIYVSYVFAGLTSSDAAKIRSGSDRFSRYSRILLVVFGILQLLIFGSFMAGGSLLSNPRTAAFALPLGGLGSGLGRNSSCSGYCHLSLHINLRPLCAIIQSNVRQKWKYSSI
jgi:hypothetical protein